MLSKTDFTACVAAVIGNSGRVSVPHGLLSLHEYACHIGYWFYSLFCKSKLSARHPQFSVTSPNYFGTALPAFTTKKKKDFLLSGHDTYLCIGTFEIRLIFPGKMAANVCSCLSVIDKKSVCSATRRPSTFQRHLEEIQEIKRRGQKKRWNFATMIHAVVRSFRERLCVICFDIRRRYAVWWATLSWEFSNK